MKHFLLLSSIVFLIASCSVIVQVNNSIQANYIALNMKVAGIYSTQHNDTTYILSLEEYKAGFGDTEGYGNITFFSHEKPEKNVFRMNMKRLPRMGEELFDIFPVSKDTILATLDWRWYEDTIIVANPYNRIFFVEIKEKYEAAKQKIVDKKASLPTLKYHWEIESTKKEIKRLEYNFKYTEKVYLENLHKFEEGSFYQNFPEYLVFKKVPDPKKSSKKTKSKVAVDL